MFYSKTTNGFYDPEINSSLPDDAVEISLEEWETLLNGQANGKLIKADSKGRPYLADPDPLNKDQTITYLSSAIQQSLNTGSTTWGYDNIVSGCSYANSTNAQYAADAAALIKWRDDTWEWANAKFENVAPGTTADEFMQDAPLQPPKPTVN